jgi:hypothetical protein
MQDQGLVVQAANHASTIVDSSSSYLTKRKNIVSMYFCFVGNYEDQTCMHINPSIVFGAIQLRCGLIILPPVLKTDSDATIVT